MGRLQGGRQPQRIARFGDLRTHQTADDLSFAVDTSGSAARTRADRADVGHDAEECARERKKCWSTSRRDSESGVGAYELDDQSGARSRDGCSFHADYCATSGAERTP